MKKGDYYTIKYKLFGQPYSQVVNGAFRLEENAMKKVKEITQDLSVSEVIVRRRRGYKSIVVYTWSNGFECVYLNRQFS